MALQGQRQEKDPSVSDFHHDMNEHGNAEYKKVAADAVAELDSAPGDEWMLTIWRAVGHPTKEGYVPPENSDNRYAWDAVGRAEYDDREEAEAKYSDVRGRQAVKEFGSEHPYEGPRPSYAERVRDEPED